MTSTSSTRSRSSLGKPVQTGLASKSWMQGVLHKLSRAQRTAVVSALVVIMVGGVGLGGYSYTHQPVELLTTKLDSQDTREIATLLLRNGIEHQVSANEESVTVQPAQLERARLLVADARLPRRIPPMSPSSPFQGSQQAEKLRNHLILQQDVANSLRQFSGVADADVKLAFPEEQSSFNPIPVTAAVTLHLQPGAQLSPDQVKAVVHMVAASVPELPEKEVKVLDAGSGRELTDELDENGLVNKRVVWQLEKDYADYLSRQSQRQLDTILGQGRASVLVTCKYDQSEEDSLTQVPGSSGAVTIGRQVADEVYNTTTGEDKGKEYNKHVLSEKISASNVTVHKISHQPRLLRIDASVGFDNVPANKVSELTQMVMGGLGMDESRGDRLAVSNLPFQRISPLSVHSNPPAAPAHPVDGLLLSALAACLLVIPAGLLWFQSRHRGVIVKTEKGNLPTQTSTDLSDLLRDKRGTLATLLETRVATSPELVEKMPPRQMVDELRSQWLGHKDK